MSYYLQTFSNKPRRPQEISVSTVTRAQLCEKLHCCWGLSGDRSAVACPTLVTPAHQAKGQCDANVQCHNGPTNRNTSSMTLPDEQASPP